MKTFTHDKYFLAMWQPRERTYKLDKCIKCHIPLDIDDWGQVYAHHDCWGELSPRIQNYCHEEISKMLKEVTYEFEPIPIDLSRLEEIN